MLATHSSLSADPALVVAPRDAVLPLPLVGDGVAAAILAAATTVDPCLVLVRPPDGRLARRAFVESFVDPTAVITRVVPLSQLGARLLTVLLRAVEEQHGVPAAAELAIPLAAVVEARLVLASVAKMDDPAPSVVQHVRSWLPGSTFQVLSGRRRTVLTGLVEPDGRRTPRADEQCLFTSSPSCPPALRESARALAKGRPCIELPPWPEETRQTGSNWAELVTWSPSEVDDIVASWLARPAVSCRWCARPSTMPVCASCGALAAVTAGTISSEEAQRA